MYRDRTGIGIKDGKHSLETTREDAAGPDARYHPPENEDAAAARRAADGAAGLEHDERGQEHGLQREGAVELAEHELQAADSQAVRAAVPIFPNGLSKLFLFLSLFGVLRFFMVYS